MPLTELDPNVSGRASRASNVSVSSRDKRSRQQATQSAQSDLLSSTGVVSMLRTSTELGDIAGMTFGKGSRTSHMRPAHRRRSNNASSRLSVSSSHTQTTTGISNHHPRPSSSSAPRRSMTNSLNAPVFLPDTLSPTQMNIPGASPLVPPARLSKDGRSFSLTSNYAPAHKLSKPRSFASLRHPELVQRPRSPYRYPTRLKRPGYRSPSPAMSDVTGLQSRRPRHHGHSSLPRPRNSPVSPMMPLEMGQMGQIPPLCAGFQGSIANPIQVSPLQPHELAQMPYQHAHFNRSTPTIIGVSPISDAVPRRRPVPGGSHPMLLKPMAMRPGTSLSQSTESDIPSSGAVSLAPQTPKLHHEAQVMIQPNSPHTANAPNSPVDERGDSEELIYYDYSEHFVSEEQKTQSPAPAEAASVIPGGFVNHVKNILEGTGKVGSSPISSPSPAHPVTPIEELGPEIFELPGSPVPTPPREAVELPAEPVPKRITREMILSVIEPSSTTNGNDTTTTVEAKVESIMPIRIPSPPFSPTPSVSSDGSMSTAQEQPEVGPGVASTTDGEEAPLRHSTESRSSGPQDDNRASAVDFQIRYSVPVTQGSIDSTESFSVDDSEPQLQLDITPEPLGVDINAAEDDLKDYIVATEESTGRSVFGRAKSLSVPKSPKVDVEARFSAPTLGSGQFEKQQGQAPESRIHVQISPPVIPLDVPAAQPALKTTAPQLDNQALHSAYDTPDPSPAMYSNEGTPASATQQSSSPASIPAKSFSSRESNNTTTHLVWPLRRQTVNNAAFQADEEYPSRGSVMNETISIAKDLRLSNPPRYPSQLSDVKEESCEESFSDLSKRASTRASQNFKFPYSRASATATDVGSSVDLGRRTSASFKFPLPGRSSARRTSIEELFLSRTPSIRASAPVFKSPKRPKEGNGGAFVESRLIPSMHFSQMNLLEKLSEAFGDRARLSFDGVPPDFDIEVELLRERPASLGPIREKYRSFFASLDSTDRVPDFRPKTPVTETVEVEKAKPEVEVKVEKKPEGEREGEREHEKQTETEVRSLRSDTAMSTREISRPYSPEEVLEEVERLSVPSMAGLTARLSELIPSLKMYRSSENVDEDVEDMIEDDELKADVEEMRHVGERPGLLNNMKSSRRLRPLPGKTSLVLVDDDIYEELTLREKEKREKGEVNVLRYHHHQRVEEMSNSSASYKSAQEERKISLADDDDDGKKARRKTPMAELEAPLPVHLRRSNEIEAAGKKSDDDSAWDLANVKFPSAIDIDISFPIKAHVRDRDGDRISLASSSSSEYSLTNATIKNAADAIGAQGDVNPTTTVTAQSHSTLADSTSTHDTFKNTHSRHNSRRQSGAGTSRPCTSVLGTLTRKMGMGSIMSSRHHSHHSHSHNVCNPSDPNHTHSHIYLARRTLSPNPTLTHPSISLEDTRPVDPGDRYPTTGLTPPQGRFNINIDDVRSFFSDDSSQTKGAGGLRKRLTGLRLRLAGAGPSTATAATAKSGNNANSKNPTPVTDTASSLIPLGGGGGGSSAGGAGAGTSYLTPISPLPTLSPSTRRDSPSAVTSEEPSSRSGGTLSLLPLPLRGGNGKTGDSSSSSSSGAGNVGVVMTRSRIGATSAVQPAVAAAAAAAGQDANGRGGVDGPGGPGGLGMGMSRVEFRTKRMLEKLKSFWFSLGRSLLMAAAEREREREREKKRRGSNNGGDGNGGRESVLVVRERETEEEVFRDGNHVHQHEIEIEVERSHEVDIDVEVADKSDKAVVVGSSPSPQKLQHLTSAKVPAAVLVPTITSSTTEQSSDLAVVHQSSTAKSQPANTTALTAATATATASVRGSARGRPSTTASRSAARSSRRSSTYTTSANSTTRLVACSSSAASASTTTGSRRSTVRPRASSCPGSRPGSQSRRAGRAVGGSGVVDEIGGGGAAEGPAVSATKMIAQTVAVPSANGPGVEDKEKGTEKEKEESGGSATASSSDAAARCAETTASTTTTQTASSSSTTTQQMAPQTNAEAPGSRESKPQQQGWQQQQQQQQAPNTDSSVASLDPAQLAALKFVGVVDSDDEEEGKVVVEKKGG